MAVSKLTVYNDALLLIGERKLATETDNVPSRYELDTAYDDPSAASYCLELTKPKFSLKTAHLGTPTVPTNHGLANEYAFPSDYISIHSVFADADLDQPISRYIIEGQTIACDTGPDIWMRYVSSGQPLTAWTPSFAGVVSAYLAWKIAPRFAPQKVITLEENFLSVVNAAVQLEGIKEVEDRPRAATATLSNSWRKIYNKAFFILGLDEIISNTDDSMRRIKADVVVGMGLVETVLEDLGWTFGLTSQKIDYDPSLEPAWGHNRVFEKPIDMHRVNGVFQDSFFRTPLKDYVVEGEYIYCSLDEIYIQYVKESYLTNVDDWPQYFTNVVASEMAVLLAPGLAPEMLNHALNQREVYNSEAASTDAMSGPPQVIRRGSWSQSRATGRTGSYNGRP